MIDIGSLVCYRDNPDVRGTVVAIRTPILRWLPRTILVRWEPQFCIIPALVFESEIVLELVSDCQHQQAA